MNFKITGYALSAAAAMGLLASCSSDDFAEELNVSRTVDMTVSLTKDAGNASRTAFNEVDGSLDCTWTATDRVVVAAPDGTKIATLAIDPEDAGKATARFTGKVEVTGEGNTTMNFIYLGNLTNAEAATSPVYFNYATQKGTLAGLADYDFFWQSAEVNLGATEAFATVADMQRHVAFGHFTLSFPAEAGWTGGDVTVAGSGLVTNATLAFNGAPSFSGETGTIATKATADGDLYITVIPVTTDLTFTATVAGKTYTGTLPSREWKANEYVRKNLGNGTYAGVEVAMAAEGDNDEELNEYGEPINNPLAKWAKGNLYRVDGLTNGIADDELENGALYQWGRNYGYMDTKGIYEGTNVNPGNDFTNYLDAMGEIVIDYDNHYSRNDYYVYNPTDDGIISGTGIHLYDGWRWEDGPYTYSSADDIKAHPTKYFMDANPLGRTEDYWISTFGDGGSTWEERAAACGYENTNPCPEGWRLPTEAELRAIMPQTNIELSRGSLTELFNNTGVQLREYNGIRYVIRWLNNSNYIEIQSLIVDENFKASDASTITWESNKNVVSRKFPYTGHIDNVMGFQGYPMLQYYALPYHRYRTVDKGVWLVNVGDDGKTYPDQQYVKVLPSDNYCFSYGAYWVSDGQFAMKFSNRQSFEASSYFEIGASGAAMGFAIRPVRDSK